jgi:hypothetical protein
MGADHPERRRDRAVAPAVRGRGRPAASDTARSASRLCRAASSMARMRSAGPQNSSRSARWHGMMSSSGSSGGAEGMPRRPWRGGSALRADAVRLHIVVELAHLAHALGGALDHAGSPGVRGGRRRLRPIAGERTRPAACRPGVRGLEGDAGRRGTIETLSKPVPASRGRRPGVNPRPAGRRASRLHHDTPAPARHRRRAASRSLRRLVVAGVGSRGPAPSPSARGQKPEAREEIGRRSPSPVTPPGAELFRTRAPTRDRLPPPTGSGARRPLMVEGSGVFKHG